MGHVRGREWVRPMQRKVSNSNTGLEVIEPTWADTARLQVSLAEVAPARWRRSRAPSGFSGAG